MKFIHLGAPYLIFRKKTKIKTKNKKKQKELGVGCQGGGKNLPVTKHKQTSLNRPELVLVYTY